ncbi:MAG: Rieske 2Fe-2S domain-containing protein [Armatimonadetes bacterium]|nr:Rieske 2Fe-2S domain-containing protein [Armatimonadota bacterium]MDE2207944.1 Rieske 2Fe-2S domain-containing protein [Armatimonadota bacterium]
MKLIELLTAAELGPGECRVVRPDGLELALCNVDGTYYCVENECPHSYGPLGEGTLEGDTLTCPIHGWEFNVVTGESMDGWGVDLTTFPCHVVEGRIYVELPESGPA